MSGGVDLHSIVRRLGGDLYDGGRRAVVPGPGHSRRDRSLSLRETEDGRILYYSHAGDPGLAICAHLGIEARADRKTSSFELERQKRERERRDREAKARDLAFCRDIWRSTQPLAGSWAETYLYKRGLILEADDIRWAPACPRHKPRPEGDERPPLPPHGAMVALVRDERGDPMGLHCTYVTADGSKAFGRRSRLMFGPVRCGAVRIGAPSDGVLAVGEGLESCGSYSTIKGVPTWPLLTTSLMKSFRPPAGVKTLIVAADGDRPGMEAAQDLAIRCRRICDVRIDPAPDGKDWNDVLMETGA
ncbi:MAG: toprim domain-containing protein [Caulobacter sp.]